jgi:Kdo2-lipid IVA lauroyltransferase/acyltransferase
MRQKRKKKTQTVQVLEYFTATLVIQTARILPLGFLYAGCAVLGNLLYALAPRRRRIALENLRYALPDIADEQRIRAIARQSCKSFFFTLAEIIKWRFFLGRPEALKDLRSTPEALQELFAKARQIHDQAKGCIFVTPHLGNWELLLHVSAAVGIPLAVVARPLDNAYLEKLLYADRTATGQVIIPKRNAFFVLQDVLRQGKSIGMLPDQSTKKGVAARFFGRKAMSTPVPAILAVTHRRPIVVVACCRAQNSARFEGFVGDPIWPGEYQSEKAEIMRITEAVHHDMETVIRRYPEQYLWMHNRWKRYRTKKELFG